MSDWIVWPLAVMGAMVVVVFLVAFVRELLPKREPAATRWVCGCEASFASLADLKAHMALECPNRPEVTFLDDEAARAAGRLLDDDAIPKEPTDA